MGRSSLRHTVSANQFITHSSRPVLVRSRSGRRRIRRVSRLFASRVSGGKVQSKTSSPEEALGSFKTRGSRRSSMHHGDQETSSRATHDSIPCRGSDRRGRRDRHGDDGRSSCDLRRRARGPPRRRNDRKASRPPGDTSPFRSSMVAFSPWVAVRVGSATSAPRRSLTRRRRPSHRSAGCETTTILRLGFPTDGSCSPEGKAWEARFSHRRSSSIPRRTGSNGQAT